jgi:hypothetical protein
MPITQQEEKELREKWAAEESKKKSEKDAISQGSQKPYIVISLIMTIVVIVAIMLIVLLSPEGKDTTPTITLIIGLSATFTGTMFTLLKNAETHVMINNRLTQWMETNSRAERAEGERAGVIRANERTDKLAEMKSNIPESHLNE